MTNSFDELDENKFKLGKYHYISKDCEYDSQDAYDLCAFGHDDRKCVDSPPCYPANWPRLKWVSDE